ncbi:MAG: sulfide dehydrogenase [Acidobacteria bacterium]|nr:sulfide dehydrogenase [Acidobacteriota bacterium]MBS1865994.1 sulfide dehydrogenase [Acidobacteriota bacterium]
MKIHKLRITAGIAVAALLIGAALAEQRLGSYTTQNTGKIVQAKPAALAEDSEYEMASLPSFDAELANGAGRAETQIYCGTCHTPRYITMQPPLPAATWEAEIQKMVKAFGAQIPQADAQKIAQYLHEHYTPETRQR